MTQEHTHTWIEMGAVGHSSGDGSGRLMTIDEYCGACGRVAVSYQSANTCVWHRDVRDEYVSRDTYGTVGAPGAIVGTRRMTAAEFAAEYGEEVLAL